MTLRLKKHLIKPSLTRHRKTKAGIVCCVSSLHIIARLKAPRPSSPARVKIISCQKVSAQLIYHNSSEPRTQREYLDVSIQTLQVVCLATESYTSASKSLKSLCDLMHHKRISQSTSLQMKFLRNLPRTMRFCQNTTQHKRLYYQWSRLVKHQK